MSNEATVTVGVHQRLDAPGYVVRVSQGEGGEERVSKIPVEEMEEAEKLARSIVRYVEKGLPLEALFTDGEG